MEEGEKEKDGREGWRGERRRRMGGREGGRSGGGRKEGWEGERGDERRERKGRRGGGGGCKYMHYNFIQCMYMYMYHSPDHQRPFGVVILTQGEMVVHDLQSPR